MISDSGVGIQESVRDHVFEPFFTTKSTTGTGLGAVAQLRDGGEASREATVPKQDGGELSRDCVFAVSEGVEKRRTWRQGIGLKFQQVSLFRFPPSLESQKSGPASSAGFMNWLALQTAF